MAALLVAMSVMAIVLSTTLPVFSTMAKRERETELIFRGQQYARAVMLFQRKYGNALPPSIDVLLANGSDRFLRKKYKDPITNEDFQVIGPGSPELALAETAAPVQAGREGGQPQRGGGPPISQQQPFQQPQMSGRGVQSNPVTAGQAPGGVLGVVSKSKATSIRIYNNHDKYNEWVFVATQMSVQGGGGATGDQAPGGRGGQAPGAGRGRRGQPDGGGRFGQPQPGGPGPGRNPGSFGGPGMGPQGRPGGGRF
jgi:type II secretory pathway pseudopilin PulG